MCIIIHKPAGKTVTKEVLSRCFEKNKDGAGFMWVSDGKVWGNKGYMSLRALLKGLEDCGFYDPDKKVLIKKFAVTIHFRWASHGKICPQNCHPFPVCNDYDLLKARYWEADVGIAHNGIIPIKVAPGVSDTMTWIKEVFSSPIIYQNMNDSAINQLVAGSINSSRLVIVYTDGSVILVGSWVNEDGVYYSNSGFRAPVQPNLAISPQVKLVKKADKKEAEGRPLPPPGMKWAH